MSAPAAATNERAEAHSLGYNLGAIALAVVLLGLALAYAIDAAGRSARLPAHRADGDTVLTRTIGGKELGVPLSWFRYAEQRIEGFARQIDLHFTLPLGPEGAARGIDVTLLPRSTVRQSARLLDGVYLHMFEADQLSGPEGLIGKPLRATEGYATETVWYDPISPDPFVAKCGAPVTPAAPSRCLRAVHLAPGIAAVYAFDADVLGRWRDFDARVRVLFDEIGVFR
jgi:hypothetical protein